MKLLQNILVPVDLSDSSVHVVETATMLAGAFNSHLILLHVLTGEKLSGKLESFLMQSIRDKLDAYKKMAVDKGVGVSEVLLERGVAFEQIIQAARSREVNVIVAGAGSKSTDDRFRLGITVEKLIRKNQVPLWVVRNEPVSPVKKILCPVDFSDASRRALTNAVTLARQFDAKLTVLHVFTPMQLTSPRFRNEQDEENKRLRKEAQKEFDEFLKSVDLDPVKHRHSIVEGEPHREILERIRKKGIDLLLMGTTGRTALSRIMLGSVTEKVTRELPCNFITTKSKDIVKGYLESNLQDLESWVRKAQSYVEAGKHDRAVEIYTSGLKQHPDNIRMLIGLSRAYGSLGRKKESDYYRQIAREVILRIWGEPYLQLLDA